MSMWTSSKMTCAKTPDAARTRRFATVWATDSSAGELNLVMFMNYTSDMSRFNNFINALLPTHRHCTITEASALSVAPTRGRAWDSEVDPCGLGGWARRMSVRLARLTCPSGLPRLWLVWNILSSV